MLDVLPPRSNCVSLALNESRAGLPHGRRAFLQTVGVGLAGSLGAKSYAGENAPRPIAAPHTGPWTWQAVRGGVALEAGFYEWQVQPEGTKQPYYIQPAGDGEMSSIAALWDRSRTESGEDVLSCAIITMPANEPLAEIHNAKQRMPLILPPEAVDTWLTGTVEVETEQQALQLN